MEFKVGEVVVYPHHGAARIADIEHREMGGETLEYLVLQINQSDLVVRVPSKNVELVGVRDVVGKEGLEKVFSVLREIDVEEAGNWSRRYKANQERLASGDINKVAEVVRDLWRRDQDRGCPQVRSACWPRPVRSSWASSRWPLRSTRRRPTP